MAERLADVSIDADGDEFVFRVRPGDRLKRALAFLLSLSSPDAEKRDTPAAAPAANYHAANGAQPKPSLRRFTPDDDKAIAAAYLSDGLSIPDLVKKFGGTQGSIGAALDRERVVRRSTSESLRLAHKMRKAKTTAAPPDGIDAAAPRPAETRENAAPLSGRTDERPDEKTAAPGNGRNTATRASLGLSDPATRGREIERLYLEERLSPNSIAAQLTERGHPISDTAVLKTLKARKVPIRGKKEAQELSRLERGLPVSRRDVEAITPKPKPVEIPASAKRVVKTVAELTPEPVKFATGRDALRATTGVAARRAQQSQHPLNLTDAERQAAVDAYIARGGAITVVQAVDPKAGEAQPRPANVGRYEGKRR
jgi:hypothetical protein